MFISERRKHYYTDQKLQGFFLAGIVAIQVILVIGMLLVLHSEINLVVESHLYRAHRSEQGAWPEIFLVLGKILLIFFCINLAVLVIIYNFWHRYIKKIMIHFSEILDRILHRDFSSSMTKQNLNHRVSELIETWYRKEQDRDRRIGQLTQSIEQSVSDDLSTAEQTELRCRLEELRNILVN